jgi:lipoate-protein ligase A
MGHPAEVEQVIRTLAVQYSDTVPYAVHATAGEELLAVIPDDEGQGYLRAFMVPGEGLLIGRYHATPGTSGPMPAVHRRRTGGRVMPLGDGFLGVSLILPHRAALVGDDWRALEPEQVMNRCVRGVLQGLKALGMPAFYPGRDLITVDGRVLAAMSFETTNRGALLFEMIIGVGRSLALVPRLLDAVDPAGVIAGPMWTAEATVTVADATARGVAAEELAERIALGYAEVFGLALVHDRPAPGTEGDHAERDREWLRSRSPGAHLNCRGTIGTQNGVLEAYFSHDGGCLREVMLVGDFIANSPAVAAVEADLCGTPLDRAAISAVVFKRFSRPENFILGLRDPLQVAEAICRGE